MTKEKMSENLMGDILSALIKVQNASSDLATIVKEFQEREIEEIVALRQDIANLRQEISRKTNSTGKSKKRIINELFKELGIPTSLCGNEYALEAILMYSKKEKTSITNEIYPEIAKKYNTTASRVERAIRHAIESSWERGNTKNIDRIFGYTVSANKGKPTNEEFISLLAREADLIFKGE